MNKKLAQIGMALLLVLLTACQTLSLPNNLVAAPARPTTLQDELLLEAWDSLSQHQEPVKLWDGHSYSGHDLAQFVLDQAIPVGWDFKEVCHGDSCSQRYCNGDVCTHHEDGKPEVDPIYISLYFMTLKEDQMQRLVESLAHEIFHRMEPYGPVKDTQYEEFSAIFLAAQISRSTWQNFKGYDTRNPACLKRWFSNHRLFWYLDLPAYPQSVAASLESPTPTDCTLEGDLVCKVTLEGQAACQPVHLDEQSSTQPSANK